MSVLFVCLGNICRSPLAEAAFRREAERLGLDLEIDSAGTGSWNIGRPPDPRAQAVARSNGLEISDRRARQIAPEDFRRFSHIVALDTKNVTDLAALRPEDGIAEVTLLLDHVEGREGEAVPDPYYGDEADFAATWQAVSAGVEALARRIGAVR